MIDFIEMKKPIWLSKFKYDKQIEYMGGCEADLEYHSGPDKKGEEIIMPYGNSEEDKLDHANMDAQSELNKKAYPQVRLAFLRILVEIMIPLLFCITGLAAIFYRLKCEIC